VTDGGGNQQSSNEVQTRFRPAAEQFDAVTGFGWRGRFAFDQHG